MDKTNTARNKSKVQLNRAKHSPPPPRPRLVKNDHLEQKKLSVGGADGQENMTIKKAEETAMELKSKFSEIQKHVANLSRNRRLVAEDIRDGWGAILKELRSTYRKVSTHM